MSSDNDIKFITPSKQPTVIEQTSWTDGWFKLRKLNLNPEVMRQTCLGVQQVINHRYGDQQDPNYYDNQTTNLFGKYNIFMFSSAPLHELYTEICRLWKDIKPDDGVYYLQSWLNVYDKNPSIGWHYHWTEKYNAWHGFYCVDVDTSYTTYALQSRHYEMSKEHQCVYNGKPLIEHDEKYNLVNIVGQDNLLVLSPSAGDSHRNIPWHIEGRPRITIGFDIVPGRHIHNKDWENHWIPLL